MFWGLAVIYAGVLLLLQSLDIVDDAFSRYWPGFVILLGLAIISDRWRRHRDR